MAKLKESTTHVEAALERSRDAGSIPAASTFRRRRQPMTQLDSHCLNPCPGEGFGVSGPRPPRLPL